MNTIRFLRAYLRKYRFKPLVNTQVLTSVFSLSLQKSSPQKLLSIPRRGVFEGFLLFSVQAGLRPPRRKRGENNQKEPPWDISGSSPLSYNTNKNLPRLRKAGYYFKISSFGSDFAFGAVGRCLQLCNAPQLFTS